MKSKKLFILSLIPAFWIAVLALTYNIGFDAVWFGILRELLTIPLLLGGMVMLILSFIAWRKENYFIRSMAFYALLVIVVSFIVLFLN